MHRARPLLFALCLWGSPAPAAPCAPPAQLAAPLLACTPQDEPPTSQIMNAQAIDLLVQVNNGAMIAVPETGKPMNWQPTLAPVAFSPLCKDRGALWWGDNTVTVMPAQGTANPSIFRFCIPGDTNVQTQFQLYVVWNGGTAFKMLVLKTGLFFSLLDPQ